jgi:hypothetical protein
VRLEYASSSSSSEHSGYPEEDGWSTDSYCEYEVEEATPTRLRIGLMMAGLTKDADPPSSTPVGMGLWCRTTPPPPRSELEQRLAVVFEMATAIPGGDLARFTIGHPPQLVAGTREAVVWARRFYPGVPCPAIF